MVAGRWDVVGCDEVAAGVEVVAGLLVATTVVVDVAGVLDSSVGATEVLGTVGGTGELFEETTNGTLKVGPAAVVGESPPWVVDVVPMVGVAEVLGPPAACGVPGTAAEQPVMTMSAPPSTTATRVTGSLRMDLP